MNLKEQARLKFIADRDDYCCYCGLKITTSIFATKEHIVPLSAKGKNIPANKRPCCKGCNSMRGNMPLDIFLDHIIALKNANPHDDRLKGMVTRIQSVMEYSKVVDGSIYRELNFK